MFKYWEFLLCFSNHKFVKYYCKRALQFTGTLNTYNSKYSETIDERMLARPLVRNLNPIQPLHSMINGSLFAEIHDTDHRMHIIDFLILSRFVCSSIFMYTRFFFLSIPLSAFPSLAVDFLFYCGYSHWYRFRSLKYQHMFFLRSIVVRFSLRVCLFDTQNMPALKLKCYW